MIKRPALILCALLAASAASAQDIAPTPPMGWNSWDAYGLTIGEADFKANAAVLAGLRNFGWTYAVIDEGWYMANPFGDKLETRKYQLDGQGMLVPDADRFPSSANGAGFKPLADWVHAHGLKFGIHIVRGIPKQAVRDNLPIGPEIHAADAADTAETCPWDDGNYGVRDNAAGQAYYDAMMRLYARWGVDFLKVDCIADHPYRPSEIRQIAEAIRKTGRPIVLSLSPGPTQLSHAAEVGKYSQMWRIADDIWDGWNFKPKEWPNGLVTAFGNLAKWSPYAKPGNWPDADMLPFGILEPHPGWGEPRQSRLTQDEERTQFTLWAIARSPLILGANLTKLDAFTRVLISNKALIAVNQTAWESHRVTAGKNPNLVFWEAYAGSRSKPVRCLAVFNMSGEMTTFLGPAHRIARGHRLINLWDGEASTTLPPHGSAIFRVK